MTILQNLLIIITNRLSLAEDKADDATIDGRIRGDIEMRGSALWILMFAIFVASIGLNVNSTAVIIGAMLISPLMGPIMGIGYGAGINDFTLLRKSFANLATAVLIALLTSTLYFLISPLDVVGSELLARTTPTIWDVLIALFGGLAGIIGITRKEKSNVIPGVAIATALMPPLCTAGFGLATANWGYFFGAFYLFTINFVFIAVSSFLIVKLFNVAEKKYIDPKIAKKAHKYIFIVTLLTVLPSSYLAYKLVKEELFKANAKSFVNSHFNFKNANVSQIKIDPANMEIKVFLIGEHIPQKELDVIAALSSKFELGNANFKIYQNGESKNIDVSALKSDIVTELYQNSQTTLNLQAKEIENLKSQIQTFSNKREYLEQLTKEINVVFPKLKNVVLSQAYPSKNIDENISESSLIVNANTKDKIDKTELNQIEDWLKIRTKINNVKIYVNKI